MSKSEVCLADTTGVRYVHVGEEREAVAKTARNTSGNTFPFSLLLESLSHAQLPQIW